MAMALFSCRAPTNLTPRPSRVIAKTAVSSLMSPNTARIPRAWMSSARIWNTGTIRLSFIGSPLRDGFVSVRGRGRDLFRVRGAIALVGAGEGGPRRVVEIAAWRGLEVEVAKPVDASREHRGRLDGGAHVPNMSRDVADPEPDPAPVRTVRLRAMQDQRVVQRELPRAKRRVHGGRVVHDPVDRLSRAIHAVRDDSRGVRQLSTLVAARQELHAAVLRRRVGEGEPRRHVEMRRQPEVRRVLVPGRDGRALGLLDEPRRGVHEDVWPDEALDGTEDRWMTHEPMYPRQQHVRARAVARRVIGRQRSA